MISDFKFRISDWRWRSAVLLLLLMIVAAVTDGRAAVYTANSWATNPPGTVVYGSDNLAFTNVGSTFSWKFYGTESNTVARYGDVTNVVLALAGNPLTNGAAGNAGIAVAVVNGTLWITNLWSTNGFVTMTITNGLASLVYVNTATNGFVGMGITNGLAGQDYVRSQIGASNANYVLKNNGTATGLLSVENQTNSGTLDVTDNAQFFSDTYFIASAIHVYGDKSEFSNSVAFFQPAVSKLAAFDGLHHMTNSAYSDADIGPIFNARSYGWIPDGTDRITDASNLLQTVSDAGGGTIYFPAATNRYRADGQLQIPLNGTNQHSFRFTGAGSGPNWYGTYAGGSSNSSTLDLRYTGTGGKLTSLGFGSLTIDHLSLIDGGTANTTPFLFINNTTAHIDENSFIATANGGQTHIVLASTNTASILNTTNGAFQGYGTIISGNHFDRGGRWVFLGTFANNIVIRDNSGNLGTGFCAIESDGQTAPFNGNFGLVISGNLFEMNNFTNGIVFRATCDSHLAGNSFWDNGSQVQTYYLMTNNSFRNNIIKGYDVQGTVRDVRGATTDVSTTAVLGGQNNRVDTSGNGIAGSEFSYNAVVKGTWVAASNYAGALNISSQFVPSRVVSIGYDDTADAGVIRAWNTAAKPLALNPVSGNVGVGETNPLARFQVTGNSLLKGGLTNYTDKPFDTNLVIRYGTTNIFQLDVRDNGSGGLMPELFLGPQANNGAALRTDFRALGDLQLMRGDGTEILYGNVSKVIIATDQTANSGLGIGMTSGATLGAKLQVTNSAAQVVMRLDQLSTHTNDLFQAYFGNTLLGSIKTNSYRFDVPIYAPTNTAPIVTGSNPTNSYTTGTVYFNLAQRSMLVGSAVLNGGVSGTANITLNYTNEGTGYQLPMQTGAGLATTDIFPFCVPLSTNASFQFVSTMGTGATGSLTNVVLWQH